MQINANNGVQMAQLCYNRIIPIKVNKQLSEDNMEDLILNVYAKFEELKQAMVQVAGGGYNGFTDNLENLQEEYFQSIQDEYDIDIMDLL